MCTYPLREPVDAPRRRSLGGSRQGLIPGDLAEHERLDSFAGPELCIARLRCAAA